MENQFQLHDNMEFIKTEKGGNTIKYVFKRDDDMILEFTYIQHIDKISICIPSHTMCNLGCKFCHTTKHIGYIPMKPVTSVEVLTGVGYIIDNLELKEHYNRVLISWMGTGEPMMLPNIVNIMQSLKDKYNVLVRFSIATMLPIGSMVNFIKFTAKIKKLNIPVKVHFSLHYVEDAPRKEMMPSAIEIQTSLNLCKIYKEQTGNDVEVHYTLIKGKNDTQFHINVLHGLLKGTNFNVKYLAYNTNEMLDDKATSKKNIEHILKQSRDLGLVAEYYKSPGIEIGASCGSFKIEEYKDHQKIKGISI